MLTSPSKLLHFIRTTAYLPRPHSSLVSRVKITTGGCSCGIFFFGGGGGAARPGYSLLTHQIDERTTCDFTMFFFFFFFFVFFLNIIPVISGLREDNIKLCAMETLIDLYMYFMHQVREGS